MGVRYYVESNGGPRAMCEHKHLAYGEATAHPPLSSCGAEIVPCHGAWPQGQPSLRHLMSGSKREPRRTGLGWERPVANSRTRDEASAGWSCNPLTDMYAVRHKQRVQIGRIQWRIMYLKTRNELTSDGGEVTFAPFTTPYNVFHVESCGRFAGGERILSTLKSILVGDVL
jgi:hypothetical protein